MIVSGEDFRGFLGQCVTDQLGGYEQVYVPAQLGEDSREGSYFAPILRESTWQLKGHRPLDPIKLFFYQPREQVLPLSGSDRKMIIAGVKACDLRGLQVLDRALLEQDFVDPLYRQWRENVAIISADCTSAADSCHCTLVDGNPYPTEGFDLNLSKVDERFVVTIGSQKGEKLANLMRGMLPVEESTAIHHNQVEDNRKAMTESLRKLNRRFNSRRSYTELLGQTDDLWAEESEKCVGCGGCTNICPTCHCIILNDESSRTEFKKVRDFDSCQLNGYARVAGGGTPRPHMTRRFRHRYLCKFHYMPENFAALGCTGCGRCIDVCPGGIEFRAVIANLAGAGDISAAEKTAIPEEVY